MRKELLAQSVFVTALSPVGNIREIMPVIWKAVGHIVRGFGDPVVLTLGITQTIGYGTLYYVYGVVAPSVAREFNVSVDMFFAAFTAGLLLSGFAAPMAGRALDQRGARRVMTFGSIAAALSLGFCAVAPNIWWFSAAVFLAELSSCLVLYEAAFAALVQIHGGDARSRITQITLMAGFASTIFWPLSQWLLSEYGWRITFAVFAMANLIICAPLHFKVLSTAAQIAAQKQTPSTQSVAGLVGQHRQRAMLLYGAAVVISGLVFASVPVHMLRIIENEGFSADQAALIAMAMGPAQVAARIIEVTAGQRITPLITGCVSMAALLFAFAVLLLAPASTLTAVLFAGAYGAAQGLITIARGTIPLHVFGSEGYATFVGKVTGIRFFTNAFSPLIFAALMTRAEVDMALLVCLFCAAVSLFALIALRRMHERLLA
jgi:MFS family permease